MAWRDELGIVTLANGQQLVGGSFRGVTFRTVGAEIKVGRRNVVNEYPQRDTPYVDDLGRRARRFVVDCHVIGDNYLVERDALIAALETKGPGELVHPRYGSRWVSVEGEVSLKESPEQGGMARVSVTFVEDGGNAFPSAANDTLAEVEMAANAADDAAQADFLLQPEVTSGVLLSDALDEFSASLAAIKDLTSRVANVQALADVAELVSSTLVQLNSLITTPLALAETFRQTYTAVINGLTRPLTALSAMEEIGLANSRLRSVPVPGTSQALRVATANARAALQRRLLLSSQSRTLVLALANSSVVATRDQAVALRNTLMTQMDVEIEENDPPIEYARALTKLRLAVVRDVSARGEQLKRRAVYKPQTVLPAVVLAYRVYQDAGRADELVARNGVRHPAFVPARQLETLW